MWLRGTAGDANSGLRTGYTVANAWQLQSVQNDMAGRYVLASVWEDEGALIVFDAATFKEVKRLPMRKPVGKYNVWNKISRSEGTSH